MCIVIDKLIGDISTVMYSYVLIILLLATGLYFTFRTRFVQFRMFLESIRVVGEKPEKAGATSSFQALMVSTASRVGTGNIIGISTAICAGGFGAVFWMWAIAIIGGASAFVESTLAQIYKRRDPETGESYGGPSYYIEAAPSQPSPGHHLRFLPDPDLRRRLQYAGLPTISSPPSPDTASMTRKPPPGSSAPSWPCWWATASWAAASAS